MAYSKDRKRFSHEEKRRPQKKESLRFLRKRE